MPDATSSSGQQFALDLQQIREARGVALQDVHEETKIPIGLLEQFEQTGLFDHPMFNRVYLRSLVRTYAEMIHIPTDTALSALDKALNGTYRGELLAATSGQKGVRQITEAEEPLATERRPPAEPVEPPEQPHPPTAAAPPPPEAEPPLVEPPAVAAADEAAAEVVEEKQPLRPVGTVQTAAGPEAQARARPSSRPKRPDPYGSTGNAWQWVAGVVVILLLAAGIWAIIAFTNTSTPEAAEPVAEAVPEPDTVDVAPPEPVTAGVTVGDTIDVVVVAETGPVQQIRVTQDTDSRRPYWIEQGRANRFPVLERIVIEEQLEKIRLLVEGYEFPTSRRDSLNRIVITRETAEAFADTLTGDPVPLNVTPTLVRLRQ